jgi:hypothetical protein
MSSLIYLQVADEEVARVPEWLASLHCPSLCLSCHLYGPAGYLMFSHGRSIPEALLQNVFSDYRVWSHEADFDGHEGVFYRCQITDDLNERVGNIEQKIEMLEVCTLQQTCTPDGGTHMISGIAMQQHLARMALLRVQAELEQAMRMNSHWVAELDVTISLAIVSAEKCFVRPHLTRDNILKIVKGVLFSIHPATPGTK